MGKKKTVQEVLTITFGMLLVSAAVYFFMVPSKIVVGSVSGAFDCGIYIYRKGLWREDGLYFHAPSGIFMDF